MVTGSHKPRDENRFKLLLGAEPVYGAALRELVTMQSSRASGGRTAAFSVSNAYIILFADCSHGTDDALYVAIKTLNAISRNEQGRAAFRRSLPLTAATPELRVPRPEHRKLAVVREVAARLAGTGAEVNTTDGIRATTPDGWWLLRASGTEPKLTVRCEASDEAGLESLRRELLSHLQASGVECQLDSSPRRRLQPIPTP